ncbi:MAG: Rieske 2Fe-2S domain-containing protein [Microbacterium sp.]
MAEDHEQHVESYVPSSGLAVAGDDPIQNPGLPPHRERITDKDPAARKRAERGITILLYVSIAASIWSVAAYMLYPIEGEYASLQNVRYNNLAIGIGIAFALLAIGIAGIHWSKALMDDHEQIEERHSTRGSEETRAAAVQGLAAANEESGFGRRKLIRNSLFVAVGASLLPGITLFRNLAPNDGISPVTKLNETMWKKGERLVRDPFGTPVKASDVTLGSAFHIIPESLYQITGEEGYLEAKAKAIVLMVRVLPEQLIESEERKDWSYDGIVAYSKVCTHVGCPVALYEQQTHHLLCPCHQSQFDITDHAKVVFGPAARPLPQLPITVDDEGYLIAQDGFSEAVGPSFWERH